MKDLYSILEISSTANQEDIKKSYRKLAFKYHPDKNKDESSLTKFKEISEAYEILSNKEKKQQFDAQGYESLQGLSSPLDLFSSLFGDNFKEIMKQTDTNMFVCSVSSAPKQTKTVANTPKMVYELHVTLSDLWHGTKKKFSIKHKTKDGTIKETNYDINIKPGSTDGESIFVKGGGNYLESKHIVEDLVITLVCRKNDHFIRNNNDLYMTKQITIAESLCDCTLSIKYFKTNLFVSTNSVIKNDTIMMIRDKGMPIKGSENSYGDLYIRFLVDYPESLSDYDQLKIKEIWDLPDDPENEDAVPLEYYGTTDDYIKTTPTKTSETPGLLDDLGGIGDCMTQ